jgi:hypothetical protein
MEHGARLMVAPFDNLTGVWHGLYSYSVYREPVYFVATLIDAGSSFSGATHESEIGQEGAPLTLFANVEGSRSGKAIIFTKAYDGSGGWSHAVSYAGMITDDGTEIEGLWSIGSEASGRFLMIRSRGVSESTLRIAFEKV